MAWFIDFIAPILSKGTIYRIAQHLFIHYLSESGKCKVCLCSITITDSKKHSVYCKQKVTILYYVFNISNRKTIHQALHMHASSARDCLTYAQTLSIQ